MDAWGLLVDQGTAVPTGMRPFLRAATVSHSEAEGVVVIELPAGPGLERLEEPSARRSLKTALGGLMSAEPDIVVRASGDEAPARRERISTEAVRNDRMKGLITNPFFLAAVCFFGGAIFISWLWFALFDFGAFWSTEGVGTKKGVIS